MFNRFIKDEGGNIAIMFSTVLLLILAGVGGAIDMSQLLSDRQKVADLADSTALAAALIAREGNLVRQEKSEEYFKNSAALETSLDISDDVSIVFDDSAKEVTVTVAAKTEFFLLNIFGHAASDVVASSTVGYAIDYIPPISIAFAFDTSGSMAWNTTDGQVKIDALEAATGDLFTAMFSASETPALLNNALTTAFSTYNTDLVISDSARTGYQHILDTMQTDLLFDAVGGTNSTPSVQFAIDQLIAEEQAATDPKWSGNLIFMTDGDNNPVDIDGNVTNADTNTTALCDAAKARGYTIYTVAFALDPDKPTARNLLENCASDANTFFESADADDLKNSFEIIGKQLGEATVRIKR
jgi:Flp pilus assembly protein TadG